MVHFFHFVHLFVQEWFVNFLIIFFLLFELSCIFSEFYDLYTEHCVYGSVNLRKILLSNQPATNIEQHTYKLIRLNTDFSLLLVYFISTVRYHEH